MKPVVKVKIGAEMLPEYKTEGSAGADIRSAVNCSLISGEWMPVPTGLFVEIPVGYEIQIRSRSGLAANDGVFVLNSPGTIDSDYRGEIKIILMNVGKKTFKIEKGDRIAQMVIAPVKQCEFELVYDLNETERNNGGFGSTGKK